MSRRRFAPKVNAIRLKRWKRRWARDYRSDSPKCRNSFPIRATLRRSSLTSNPLKSGTEPFGCLGAPLLFLRAETAGTPLAPSENDTEKPEGTNDGGDGDNGFDWHQNAPRLRSSFVRGKEAVLLIQINTVTGGRKNPSMLI